MFGRVSEQQAEAPKSDWTKYAWVTHSKGVQGKEILLSSSRPGITQAYARSELRFEVQISQRPRLQSYTQQTNQLASRANMNMPSGILQLIREGLDFRQQL